MCHKLRLNYEYSMTAEMISKLVIACNLVVQLIFVVMLYADVNIQIQRHLTLYGHMKTAEQRSIIQHYGGDS